MAKRNVMFTKPDEPNFLKRMKQEIGYKETCTVDTKRGLPMGPEDLSDGEYEEPQVVVLNPGDLSKEEVEAEKKKKAKEDNEKPADLNERILFKPKKKEDDNNKDILQKPKKTSKVGKLLLSFVDEELD